MAVILKCKMCGGDLAPAPGESVTECEFCGTKQTVPNQDNEKKLTLFSRANRLRFGCEFDKAAGIYESIIAEFPEEAEAYWGLVLCKYGIEYVDDPATGKKIPTCHRSSFDSVMDDPNLEQALENADAMARRVYRDEAKAIEELRKSIIEVSGREEPYDIFICYKETAPDGNRTVDSVLAQDVYDALTEKGYRVFFSRVTLEDKLGQEYEPYIFAALNSARLMLAFGTDYEYYNAVWVKNEWSRFLKLMAQDKGKYLIPCYKNLDPYDMPKEFAKLQAQDMGKVGAIQDLLRGIEKILGGKKTEAAPQPAANAASANTESFLKRAFMFLEDGNWQEADAYCEKVLDIDPENAQAYLGKLMAERQAKKLEALADCDEPFAGSKNYQKAVRFADDTLRAALTGYNAHINERNESNQMEETYKKAVELMAEDRIGSYNAAADIFASIPGYKDAEQQIPVCKRKVEEAKARFAVTREEYLRWVYTAVITATFGCRDEKELAAALDSAKNERDVLSKQIEGEEAHAEAMKAAIARAESEVAALKEKRGQLGIFAGKAKKQIDEELAQKMDFIEETQKSIPSVEGLKKEREEVIFAIPQMERALQALREPDLSKIPLDTAWGKRISFALRSQRTFGWGSGSAVGLCADGTVVITQSDDPEAMRLGDTREWRNIVAVATSGAHAVGVKTDGTVVAAGENRHGECDVSKWNNIVAIEADLYYTVGLRADGTVVAAGDNYYGRCNVSEWHDIVAVVTGIADYEEYTAGLKADGTVVMTGKSKHLQCDVSKWHDIIAVATGNEYIVGLKADGTVVAAGENDYGRCEVSEWHDVVAVVANSVQVVGLKADGTIVTTHSDDLEEAKQWRDIVSIIEADFVFGLKKDGTVSVLALGWDEFRCAVGSWHGIIAIAWYDEYIAGLRTDGTVVTYTLVTSAELDLSKWRDMLLPPAEFIKTLH